MQEQPEKALATLGSEENCTAAEKKTNSNKILNNAFSS